jgi:signal transduction histidine kinase
MLIPLPPRKSAFLAVAALALFLSCVRPSLAQQTTCFASLQHSDAALDQLFGDDADTVIGRIRARLAANDLPQGQSRAHLYAMLADAYYVQGDDNAARDAAVAGLAAITAGDGEPLRRRLNLVNIYLLGETGQLAKAAQDFEAAAALVPGDAPDLACVLEIRGYMRIRSDRIVDAANDLLRAAQLAKERGSERYRLDAESVLSMLYANYGLFPEAHALVEEALAAGLKTQDKIDIANAYYRRGDVYLLEGDLAKAEVDFRRSAELSRNMDQPSLAAQADERLCTTLAATTRFQEARLTCERAIGEAAAAKDPESVKLACAALGQVEFGDHHPRQSFSYLNRSLSAPDGQLPPQQYAQFRKLRGQVRAALGDTDGALEDTNAYVAWTETEGAKRKIAQMAMARAKLDATIAEQQLGRVRAEANAAKFAAADARLVANLFILATALIFSVGFFSWWLWRRRREVARIRLAAEERFSAIGQLTAGIAHEFNNQLTVVGYGLDMLARRPAISSDAESQSLIRELRQSTQTSATITAQLKSFGRQQNLDPQVLTMDSFFERIGSLLRNAVGNRITIRYELGSPPPVVYADQRALTEALINLVGNARDAMNSGGVVTIKADADTDQFAVIRVIDEGVGMPAEVLERASEPFFTTKPVGSGTGLGLSMVEGFVTQSGGSMKITSAPGRGTTVTLRFPTRRAPQ